MTTSTQAETLVGAHRIPEPLPRDWSAANIVYSKCGFCFENGLLCFELSPSSVAYPETDIDTFLQALFDETLPPGTPIPPLPVTSTGVLDMQIDNCCYLVLELDEPVGWQFSALGVGLTTLEDYGDTNAQLRHCQKGSDGYVLLPNTNPGPGCTLVYFSVVSRSGACSQKFNFHIELMQTAPNLPLSIIIDPIVGTGSAIPPPNPPEEPTS